MTVASETNKSGPYAGSGTTGPFTVGFRFLDETHIRVIKTSTAGVDSDLTLTTDYTVAGVGNDTGSVTLVSALATGEKLTIIRDVPFVQETDYQNNDAFPAESHENALDLLTMQTQQLKEEIDRSIKVPATDTTTLEQLTADLITVAGISTDVTAVAGIASDVTTAAANIAAIVDAPNQASAAADSAAAALVSENAAAASYDAFDDRYLGSKASDPTLDNDGNALLTGALYWNSGSNEMRVYTGSAWQAVAQGVSTPYQSFSGTGAQTAFTLAGTPGSIGSLEVYISGVRQVPVSDYTLSGTTLTFTSAPPSGTNNVFVRWISTQAINVPADQSVTQAKIDPTYEAGLAKLAGDQNWTGSPRATPVTDNDGSFDMSAGLDFLCTPTAGFTLTFTNITQGQRGCIYLVNGSNYTIAAAGTTKVTSTLLATISVTGEYWLSYWSPDGTNVLVSAGGPFA
jgi:hypothetical protein